MHRLHLRRRKYAVMLTHLKFGDVNKNLLGHVGDLSGSTDLLVGTSF